MKYRIKCDDGVAVEIDTTRAVEEFAAKIRPEVEMRAAKYRKLRSTRLGRIYLAFLCFFIVDIGWRLKIWWHNVIHPNDRI